MKKNKLICAIVIVALILSMLCGCGQSAKNVADLVVYGNIYTANEAGDFAEAFAVKDGKYIYVGDAKGAEAYIGKNTKTVKTGFVMPSAVESHAHYFYEEAMKLGLTIQCYKEDGSHKTTAEIVQDVVAYREANPDIKEIYGYGWDKMQLYYMGEETTRQKIDEYISDIPVYISGSDLHGGWCNTKCLELAGALYDEIPIEGVVRDENGVATGRINDEACEYIRNAVFSGIENYEQAVLNAQEILHSEGYTMILDPLTNTDGTTGLYDAIKKVDESGKLNMMVYTSYCIGSYTDYEAEIEKAVSIKEEKSSAHHSAKYVKLFIDGTEFSCTAYMLEPYAYTGGYGTNYWNPEVMNRLTTLANKSGLLVHTHAYGDASARQTIDAYEASNIANGQSYRNSIAHAPYVADVDIQRIADLGLGVSGCGNWSVGCSQEDLETMEAFLGYERCHDFYVTTKWVEYGVKAGMSTDRPCADGFAEDVFDYIGVLTTGVDYRRDYEQVPLRDEFVSVEDAIKMMTINGAWTLDADTDRGSIEVGKYADFIFADGNPFDIELSKMHTINVIETYFEGKSVYKR